MELLIASALILAILGATVAVLLACYRHYRETEAAISVHERTLKALTLLERELKESTLASIGKIGSPTGIVFATARSSNGAVDFDPQSHRPIWRRRVAYILRPEGELYTLVRKEEPLASPSHTPPLLDPSKNTAYFAGLSGGAVVARGVKTFEVTVGSSLDVRMSCSETVHRGGSAEAEFAVDVATKLTPRN